MPGPPNQGPKPDQGGLRCPHPFGSSSLLEWQCLTLGTGTGFRSQLAGQAGGGGDASSYPGGWGICGLKTYLPSRRGPEAYAACGGWRLTLRHPRSRVQFSRTFVTWLFSVLHEKRCLCLKSAVTPSGPHHSRAPGPWPEGSSLTALEGLELQLGRGRTATCQSQCGKQARGG